MNLTTVRAEGDFTTLLTEADNPDALNATEIDTLVVNELALINYFTKLMQHDASQSVHEMFPDSVELIAALLDNPNTTRETLSMVVLESLDIPLANHALVTRLRREVDETAPTQRKD